MTIQEQLIREIEDLSPKTQAKILKLISFLKTEILPLPAKRGERKTTHALEEIDEIAVETGIPDLASQHDHYLYGVPKE